MPTDYSQLRLGPADLPHLPDVCYWQILPVPNLDVNGCSRCITAYSLAIYVGKFRIKFRIQSSTLIWSVARLAAWMMTSRVTAIPSKRMDAPRELHDQEAPVQAPR